MRTCFLLVPTCRCISQLQQATSLLLASDSCLLGNIDQRHMANIGLLHWQQCVEWGLWCSRGLCILGLPSKLQPPSLAWVCSDSAVQDGSSCKIVACQVHGSVWRGPAARCALDLAVLEIHWGSRSMTFHRSLSAAATSVMENMQKYLECLNDS